VEEQTSYLQQLATQGNIIIEQNVTTNDYLSTIVTAILYLCIMASFLGAYYITKGKS
jgi:hypothetical protein